MIILSVVGALLANPTYNVEFKQFDPTESVTVVSTECGTNSLQLAKIAALDKANGIWIRGERHVDNNSYNERITQYNGGVIRKYDIVDQSNNCTTIKAEIIPRQQNGMHTNSLDVPSEIRSELDGRKENYKSRKIAIKEVDNRKRALKFVTKSLRYENKGSSTIVIVDGDLLYQNMWLSEYQELQNVAGKFDLESFRTPMRVNINAMNGNKLVENINFRFNDELTLYEVHPSNNIKIYPRASERVRLTFSVETDKLVNVNKFLIEFI